ncbi:hypothetical protein PR202_ga20952 [Eleusine coracana subsp. coracana]|uniref:Gnk2-homologous domain-containing protein n=1 Tax=Eleusine coracana subsp. coracana TaxID=191504 RepID=A0AAV5CZP0_ELECO|nr:hypothetical protein PR202_ga20952 [Eleusine coracana subsp. coracana]
MGARQPGASPRLTAGVLLALAALLSPLVVQRATAAAPFLPWQVCRNSGNYSANSTYESNLIQLSTTVPISASRSPVLFANRSIGAAPATVYSLALCRGDTNVSSCESCVAAAFRVAQELCPFDRDAAILQDLCYVRFSDLNILSILDNGDPIRMPSPQNASSSAEAYDDAVGILLNATSDAAMNSSRRFATGMEDFDSSSRNPAIFGMSQCTPDMTPTDCRRCLAGIISTIPQYLRGREGGRISGLRCSFRSMVAIDLTFEVVDDPNSELVGHEVGHIGHHQAFPRFTLVFGVGHLGHKLVILCFTLICATTAVCKLKWRHCGRVNLIGSIMGVQPDVVAVRCE